MCDCWSDWICNCLAGLNVWLPHSDWICDCLGWLDVWLPDWISDCWSDWMCDYLAWLDVRLLGLTGCATALFWCEATCPFCCVCLVCFSVYVLCLSSMHVCLSVVNYFFMLLTCVESFVLPPDTDWMCDCLAWLDVRLPGLTGCATACASWVHCFHVSLIRVAGVALSTFRRWSILPDCEITFVWFGATCPVWLVCLVCLSVYVVCLSSMHVCPSIVNYFFM